MRYQLATPPLVIHIFCPLSTHSSPFFTAVVASCQAAAVGTREGGE